MGRKVERNHPYSTRENPHFHLESTFLDLRPAKPEDLAQIEAVVLAAYSPWVELIGAVPGPMRDDYAAAIAQGYVQVLEDTNRVEALLVLIPLADAMLLDNLAVHPSAQGKGHGRRLMRVTEAAAIAAGFQRIRLYTHEKMSRNIALYQGHGYQITRRVKERGLNRVYLEKLLDQPNT